MLPVIQRIVPVVGDPAVEMEFGTGAVKVTPGHDPTDFEIGQRHGLPIISAMNEDATMNDKAGPYAGLDRYDARTAIVRDLTELGYLEKTSRTSRRRPLLAMPHGRRAIHVWQWFVQMKARRGLASKS